MKKMYMLLGISAFVLATSLVACGDDGSDSGTSANGGSVSESDVVVATYDDLPVCSGKREGITAYVKDEKIAYVCESGEWNSDDGADSNDDNDGDSSSSVKLDSSSSISKSDSLSLDEKVSESSSSADVIPDSSFVVPSSDSEYSASSSSKEDEAKSSSSLIHEQDSSVHEQPDIVGIKDKSIAGVGQKGPFVAGSSVKLYELDGETYAPTGKKFTSEVVGNNGEFYVYDVTLASQYALLGVKGYYLNEVSGEISSGTITLNALTDLSDREKVNVNLLTHLEYERVLYLVSTGVSFPVAKKQAEAEILKAFDIQGDFVNPEDLNIFSKGDGDAALLAISVLMQGNRSETELAGLLTKFATDIEKDGEWNDTYTKSKIADWASELDLNGKLSLIRSNINSWGVGAVPDFEKYVRIFWYKEYGLTACDAENEGEVASITNKFSDTYSTRTRYVICNGDVWREASDIEKETYGEKCTSAEVGKIMNGKVTTANKYFCSNNGWVNFMSTGLNPKITYGTMRDSRDDKVYMTVKIGRQIWMAENLNYADSIKTPSLKGRSWCYENKTENCELFGRLYTWASAIDSVALANDADDPQTCDYKEICSLPTVIQGICPDGWHLPTYEEWETLFTAVGGENKAGEVLRSGRGWSSNGDGTDAYGFSALPAGNRNSNGYFYSAGDYANFWSASESSSFNAYSMLLLYNYETAYMLGINKDYGVSVRCLQNSN